jgi:hypothetical protein
LPLAFGILSYILAAARHADFWEYFWSCPVTAVLLGIAILLHNRVAISTLLAWIPFAPIWTAVAQTSFCLQPEQFHHFITVAMVPIILYYHKQTWSTKGFLFGMTSFSAHTIITNNLSGGTVNYPPGFQRGVPYLPMWVGVFFVALSAVVLLCYDPLKRRLQSGQRSKKR